MSRTNHSLPNGVHTSAVIVAGLAIAASASQSALFLSSQGAAQGSHVIAILLLISAAVMLGGVVLGRLAGCAIANDDPAWIPCLCLLVYLGIASFSIITSTAQLLDAGHSTVNAENSASVEASGLRESIASKSASIQTMQSNIESMPSSWITRKERAQETVNKLEAEKLALLGRLGRVSNSSTEQAYGDVQAMFGLTRAGWSLLLAVLLEMIPFTVTLVLSYHGQKRAQAKSLGKPEGQRLVA